VLICIRPDLPLFPGFDETETVIPRGAPVKGCKQVCIAGFGLSLNMQKKILDELKQLRAVIAGLIGTAQLPVGDLSI
jgi:hypothetical protein